MKTGTIRHIAAALAAVALAAASAPGARAFTEDFDEALKQHINEAIQELCEEAWHESSASQSCTFFAGSIRAHSSNTGRCDIRRVECEDLRGLWHHNDWTGQWYELGDVANCDGTLTFESCSAEWRP